MGSLVQNYCAGCLLCERRPRNACVHEQVAKRIANVRFTTLLMSALSFTEKKMEVGQDSGKGSICDPGVCPVFAADRRKNGLHSVIQKISP